MTPELKSEIEDLVEEFELLDDWEQRYRYVIELGKALPELAQSDRTDANKVKGCVSQVWLMSEIDPVDPTRIRFHAQSDAHIVQGLAALLLRLYSRRTPDDIDAIDARDILTRIGLSEHLSPQRSNGLNAMISRIQASASQLSKR